MPFESAVNLNGRHMQNRYSNEATHTMIGEVLVILFQMESVVTQKVQKVSYKLQCLPIFTWNDDHKLTAVIV